MPTLSKASRLKGVEFIMNVPKLNDESIRKVNLRQSAPFLPASASTQAKTHI
jgi:hypothetical protein